MLASHTSVLLKQALVGRNSVTLDTKKYHKNNL